jgi:hypothetical protein
METKRLALLLLSAILSVNGVAWAGPRLDQHDAATLLSRYPAGAVPVDPTTITAIQVLGEDGTRQEISLLRNLAEHERDEVRAAAVAAISQIRSRQRSAQRESFARTIPDWADLAEPTETLQALGLGRDEAECAAYAERILGPGPLVLARPPEQRAKGDPEALLAEGRPALALAVLAGDPSPRARRLEATAWEDLGEPRGAIRQYGLLASQGDQEAHSTLDRYGIDPERLLLGMLVRPDLYVSAGTEAELLEVLVRKGGHLTVSVLAERGTHHSASDRAIATDALARMLDPPPSDAPLSPMARRLARQALVRASTDRVESIRAIALEALHQER